jgi:hypothetical protein
MNEPVKIGIDALSVGLLASTFLEVLPAAAAGVSLIWGLIRIYETKTVQGWISRWKDQ